MIRHSHIAHVASLALLAMACAPTKVSADIQTVNVVSVGGQSTSLYIVLSSNVGTDQGCPGARLLLPPGVMDVESQKRFYAGVLTALATGMPITLSVSACNGAYPSMLSTDFWFVPRSG